MNTSIDFKSFPSTRYQGSKRKVLSFLHQAIPWDDFNSALDLYSGTASMSLLMRKMDKTVASNDFMQFNASTANLMLKLDNKCLENFDIEPALKVLGREQSLKTSVQEEFNGIYFTDDENKQIDNFCANIAEFGELEKSILIYLMGQSMLMKRPFNLFHRANLNIREKKVIRTFGNVKTWNTPLFEHMTNLFNKLKKFDFSGPVGEAYCENTINLQNIETKPDFIYLDPPYLNSRGSGVNYADFYHFLDGLIDYDLFRQGNTKKAHKPIVEQSSRWDSASGGIEELEAIIDRWPNAIVGISYRGDGQPSVADMKLVFSNKGYSIKIHESKDYQYALSKTDASEEFFVANPK